MAKGQLAAATRRIGRADEIDRHAPFGQALAEEFGQRLRLGIEAIDADFGDEIDPHLQRGKAEDRRRAAQQFLDAGRRLVIVAEGEGRGVPHPAGQGLACRL